MNTDFSDLSHPRVPDAFATVNARVSPRGALENLSQAEITWLLDTSQGGLYSLFRRCALAVLNTGANIDNAMEALERYPDFKVQVVRHTRGIKLEMRNAPARAFVDGEMIRGIQEHLFAVLRDVVFMAGESYDDIGADETGAEVISNGVFRLLRNARVLDRKPYPNLIACWGGHSIDDVEYRYTKQVGYEMGLRGLDVCTGCGPGAMKGPMKGAAIGHAKQRIASGRFIGLTEPGIIAAEPPNAICNQLVILPDIEKRLEAFMRLAHGVVVFPGGAGTAEEILYLIGLLLDPANAQQPFPVVLTGPASAFGYFEQIRRFIEGTLGVEAMRRLDVIIDDPVAVARRLVKGTHAVREFRRKCHDSFNFNWLLSVPTELQRPFQVTHESMRALSLTRAQPAYLLAANLRRAFSGIVTGNVKEHGIRAIEQRGPFELVGEPGVVGLMDELLAAFVTQGRMKLPGSLYRPCYHLVV